MGRSQKVCIVTFYWLKLKLSVAVDQCAAVCTELEREILQHKCSTMHSTSAAQESQDPALGLQSGEPQKLLAKSLHEDRILVTEAFQENVIKLWTLFVAPSAPPASTGTKGLFFVF